MLDYLQQLSRIDKIAIWMIACAIPTMSIKYDIHEGGYWKYPKTAKQRRGYGLVALLQAVFFAVFFLLLTGRV